MNKFLLTLLFPFTLVAQVSTEENQNQLHQYVTLEDNKVYDIEIIVFAYKHPLPNDKTYSNKAIFDDTLSLELELKPEDLPESRTLVLDNLDSDSESPDTKPDYTVSLNEEIDNIQVLAWFNHLEEDFKLINIWDKLTTQENIIPLVHRSWRQTESPFQEPIYVKVTNVIPIENSEDNTFFNESVKIDNHSFDESGLQTDDNSPSESTYLSDLSMTGQVALSKGRFMHFENNLNLFRALKDEEGNVVKNMVFSLDEKKQIKIDELNYFDSPWMGSIVKITEYQEKNIEEINDEQP